jgi:hypothetical protein
LRYREQFLEGSQCCLSIVATEQSMATASEKVGNFRMLLVCGCQKIIFFTDFSLFYGPVLPHMTATTTKFV